MNKKINTALFILGASLFNVVLMVLLIIIGLILVGRLVPPSVGPGAAHFVMLVVFAGSIAGSFFIYHRVVRYISKKIDMDAYFHPIFTPRRKS